jgi:hypothetical protein
MVFSSDSSYIEGGGNEITESIAHSKLFIYAGGSKIWSKARVNLLAQRANLTEANMELKPDFSFRPLPDIKRPPAIFS